MPLLVKFLSSVAMSRSRVVQDIFCAQKLDRTRYYGYALKEVRTHETDQNKA